MAGPSHVDLSVLWVPIMPETSKLGQEMEQVGKDATESFGKGSSGLGDKIHESVSKSRDKIRDVFHRTGSDASDAMADGVKETSKKVEDAVEESGKKARGRFGEVVKGFGKQLVDAVGPDTKKLLGDRLEETVGGALEGVLGDNAKWAGKFSHTVADWGFDELKNKLSDTKEGANQTKAAFADFSSGNTQGGVSKLVDSFGKLGIEAKDLPGPIGDAVTKLGEAKTMAQSFADIFKDLPGKIGSVGTAIEGLAGPLAVALQSQKDMDQFIRNSGNGDLVDPNIKGNAYSQVLQDNLRRIQRDGNGNIVIGPKPQKPPGVDMTGVSGIGTRGDVLGSNSDAYDFFSSGQSLPTTGSAPTRSESTAPVIPESFASGSTVSASSPADLRKGGSRIANLYRVAESLQGTPYSQALRNDCSGMVSRLATAALGMDSSVQFSTVNEGDWLSSHGFQPGMGPPGSLRIGWYDHGGGNAGHTAATLPDGTHAESGGAHGDFRLGAGAAGAEDPQFTNHAWLPMNGTMPGISQHNPMFVTSVDENGKPTAGSGGQDAAQQLGSSLLDGLAQSVGLDGSVFKGFGGASNPKDFGITKLGMGLLNWGLGQTHGQQVSRSAVPVGPGGSQSVRTGDTYNDNSFTVNQHGVQGESVQSWQHAANAAQNRTPAMTAPNAGGGPSQ